MFDTELLWILCGVSTWRFAAPFFFGPWAVLVNPVFAGGIVPIPLSDRYAVYRYLYLLLFSLEPPLMVGTRLVANVATSVLGILIGGGLLWKNPKSIRYTATMIALYTHLGPFTKYVSKQTREAIAKEERAPTRVASPAPLGPSKPLFTITRSEGLRE